MKCYRCSMEIEIKVREKIRREALCPACSSYLHCCLNCRHYDRSAPNQCREPAVELVRDKEMANFCEYFDPSGKSDQDASSKHTANESRTEWESLFKR